MRAKNFSPSYAVAHGVRYQVGHKSAYLERRKHEGLGELVILWSYRTAVAIYVEKLNMYLRTNQKYSRTTTRHVNGFCRGDVTDTTPDALTTLVQRCA